MKTMMTGAGLLTLLLAPNAAVAQIPGCDLEACSSAKAYVSGASGIKGEDSQSDNFWAPDSFDTGTTGAGASLNATSPKGVSIQASATGSLASGALHARVAQSGGGAGDAEVTLKDLVMFELPTGVDSVTGSVDWTFEGSNAYVPDRSYASGDGWFKLLDRAGRGVSLDVADMPFNNGLRNTSWNGQGFAGGTVSRDFTIRAGTYYDLEVVLRSAAGTYSPNVQNASNYSDPSSADYGNTSFFNFRLPAGVRMLSGSGTLLSNPYTPGGGAGAVPEPATWALMILGFGAIGGAMRRRRTAARVRFAIA